jgi:hypothetical protein
MEDIEKEKLKLERQRLAVEVQLKRREQQLSREQFEKNRKGLTVWGQIFSPIGAAFLTGALGLFGIIVSGIYSIKIERQKQEEILIIDAIKTFVAGQNKEQETAANLVFLKEAGLITIDKDTFDKLKKKAGEKLPSLPASGYNPGPFDMRVQKGIFTGKIGRIKFINNSTKSVSLNLFHPDAPSNFFSEHTIPSGSNSFLGEHSYGDDWGVQINKNTRIYFIGHISSWDKNQKIFTVDYPDSVINEMHN